VFWQPFTTALVGTGMRFGEATALQVRDVDLGAGRIRVIKAWKEDENGHRYIGPPKSPAGVRSIGFDAHLHQILNQVCEGRAATSLVFANRAGQPILNGSFHSRIWIPAIAKAQAAGLTKRPSPHALRHTFASWADGARRESGQARSRRVGRIPSESSDSSKMKVYDFAGNLYRSS
jgi:integrase